MPTAKRSPRPEKKKKWGWGGARPGAGRPKSKNPRVSHLPRDEFSSRSALHVIVRTRKEVLDLQRPQALRLLEECLHAVHERPDVRVVHYRVSAHRLDLLVEADDGDAFTRGMWGLQIRLAKGLNRVMKRRVGKVLSDRYESKVLATAKEAKAVLAVLGAGGSGALSSRNLPAPTTRVLRSLPKTR